MREMKVVLSKVKDINKEKGQNYSEIMEVKLINTTNNQSGKKHSNRYAYEVIDNEMIRNTDQS